MAKVIKFDLSGADDEVWEQGEGVASEQPKPGIYQMRVKEINPGFAKGDDGKIDKSRPRLEVIWETIGDADGDREALADLGREGGSCEGAWVWDYVSYSEASEWKQAQFFKSIGEANPLKGKKKGKFNAEKHEGKTVVKVRVKSDTNLEGDYRAKVAATWPWTDEVEDADDDIDDELDEGSEEESGDELELYTEEDLKEMAPDDLKALAKDWGIETVKGKRRSTYVKEILAAQEAGEDEDEDDDDEDWDEELADDDDDGEEELDADTVRAMDAADLKNLAKENGISLKGLKKSVAIEKIIEELGIEDVPF